MLDLKKYEADAEAGLVLVETKFNALTIGIRYGIVAAIAAIVGHFL